MSETALYQKALESDVVLCELCPHLCVIGEGKAGYCGVRVNMGGCLYAAGYGRVSSLALDPVEKKPLYRFRPGSNILSVGGFGCNMRCGFCQNYHISQSADLSQGEFIPPNRLAEIAAALPKESGNIGVAFTYNEPTINIEYILEAAPLIKALGLSVVLVSNGQVNPKPLAALATCIDAWNIDLKAFSPEFYKSHGGDLETTKRTIITAAQTAHVELTTLIIPNENDGEDEMWRLSGWIASINRDIPLHISRFFPRYKYAESHSAPTPRQTLERLAAVAGSNLNYVYKGNV